MAKKAPTKSEIYSAISESTGLTRKQVGSVCEAMGAQIKNALSKKGPGIFAIPGLLKIIVVHKPATKAKPGINPFTKEPTIFKAKPARKVVKIKALKALKDMAA